jgi:hypothetical protein
MTLAFSLIYAQSVAESDLTLQHRALADQSANRGLRFLGIEHR